MCLCGSSRAALDPEVGKPYQLQVVLHVAPHRLLTPVFKDQLQRELRDSLQAAFGFLAQVEVTDRHALLKDIDARGLLPALASLRMSERKTHYLRIDYLDGQYEIQSAQHDGLTGLVSPVVRRERTADRQFVARTAALLLDRDFGMVGTIERSDAQSASVTFKGANLGVPLDRWIRKDDVFALAHVVQGRGGLQGLRVPSALLQVIETPRDGKCQCRLFHRYAGPLAPGPATLGFRCIKLGTTQGQLRLRLVDDKGFPLPRLPVRISPYGFQDRDVKEQGASSQDGLFQTRQSYSHVVFVRVYGGSTPLAQVPIEILDDRIVVCRVNVNPGAEQLGPLDLRKKLLLGRVYESLLVQADLRKELNRLMGLGAGQQATVLEKAREGLKALQNDEAGFGKALAELRAAAKELPPSVTFSLAEGDQRLQEIHTRRGELQQFIASVEDIIKKQNDPKRREWQASVERGRLLEKEAEFDEAIKLYEQVAAESNDADIKKYAEELKKNWEPKNAAHAQARTFIYQTWARLDTAAKIKDNLEMARSAFQTCRDAGDKRTVLKLNLACIALAGKLNEQLKDLRPQENEDDQEKSKVIIEVAESLEKLLREVVAYLRPAGG